MSRCCSEGLFIGVVPGRINRLKSVQGTVRRECGEDEITLIGRKNDGDETGITFR